MKELRNGLLQLVAIVMVLVMLAVSTAAFSQWASAGANSNIDGGNIEQDESAAPHPSASAAVAP